MLLLFCFCFFVFCFLYFFHTKLRGFIPVEFTWSFNQFIFFLTTLRIRAASDYPQGNRTYGVIYMTKKNHSQELRSCITKLQSFYKVGLFVAVSTLCVPLYKAFPHLFGTLFRYTRFDHVCRISSHSLFLV